MTEPQSPRTGKKPVKLHWGRLILAVLIVIAIIQTVRIMNSKPAEYKTLDYASVLTNPELYDGELACLEAVMIDRIKSSDQENTWFVVSEPDHDDHVWIVYGPLPASEASRLEAGVGVILRGVCAGMEGVVMGGYEDYYPAVRFSECTVGVQTGHSSDYLFERKLARVSEEVRTRDLPDEPHQFTLSAGNYDLRHDIPAGNCVIRWVSGYGNVSGDVYDGTIFALIGDPAEHSGAETEIDDVRLSMGILSVCGDLVVSIEYQNVNFKAEPEYIRTDNYTELTAGTYTADDISGLTKYDIVAVSGSGTVSGGELDFYGVNEKMSADPGPGEISVFQGYVPMPNRKLTIAGDLTVRLYSYLSVNRGNLSSDPETTPPEDPAPTEIPAGVVTVEKGEPAETTLEEWFALMEERTRHTPAYPEEDETTLDEWFAKVEAEAAGTARWYTVNTSTKKIHNEWCKEIQKIKPENIDYTDTPGELLADGYTWCEKCHKQ